LAPVPPAVFGSDDGIVVVSGNGTQTVRAIETASLSGAAAGVPEVRQPGASLGTRPLEEFNPASARGSYQVADILFPNGSAALGGVEREILREVVKQHRQVGGTIRVVGHASRRTKTLEPIQHKLVNFQVSAARAEAVARELIRLGVAPDELYIGAVADQDPRYREYMPSGEAGNRRAEIFIDY
jgi:flagellar motor protein MotB